MENRFKISLAASFLLHLSAVLLIFFMFGGEGATTDGNPLGGNHKMFDGVDAKNVTPKERPTEIEIIQREETSEVENQKIEKKMINADQECPDQWYGGIGIKTRWDDIVMANIIVEVYSGYAADIAGIMPDDVIYWTSEPEILGAPGTPISIKVVRNGQLLSFDMVRVKVCYDR